MGMVEDPELAEMLAFLETKGDFISYPPNAAPAINPSQIRFLAKEFGWEPGAQACGGSPISRHVRGAW